MSATDSFCRGRGQTSVFASYVPRDTGKSQSLQASMLRIGYTISSKKAGYLAEHKMTVQTVSAS